MAGMMRVYVKKMVQLDRLNVRQQAMFKIANVGVASVKNRLAAAQGPSDGPAKPLTKKYAIRKTRLGLGNRRNLSFTGDMLRGFTVRTVSENKAKARVAGSRKLSIRAWLNNKIEPWCVFSRKNFDATVAAGRQVINEIGKRLVVERHLGKQL
jgi:hypothetical protein